MNNILIKSQDGKFTGFCRYVAIGVREDRGLIGDKLTQLLYESKMTSEKLIEILGNSYRRNIERILANEEIPKPDLVKKITNKLEVEENYFKEKELENVIITDNNIVVAKYETNNRAKEVKEEIDKQIFEAYSTNANVVIIMPEK